MSDETTEPDDADREDETIDVVPFSGVPEFESSQSIDPDGLQDSVEDDA